MHPTVIRDQPGTCPVCNMELVKKNKGTEVAVSDELVAAAHSPNEQVISSIKTIRGNFTAMPVEMTRHGVVTYDTRTLVTVSARVAGRLEKVFLRYPFQRVHKGEKVAEIYSPELAAAQRDLLYLLESDPTNKPLVGAASRRLRNLGMTEKQIEQVTTRKTPEYSVAVFSPTDGFVIQPGSRTPVAPANASLSAPSDGMAVGSSTSGVVASPDQGSSRELLREGSYVISGQPLFTIVNLSSLLIEINLPPTAAGNVKRGDELWIQLEDKSVKTPIDLIQPFAQAGEQFIKVRSYVQDMIPLTVGQLVTATLRLPPVEGLWVPRTAVHDMGTRQVVFVKTREQFTPVEVVTGITTGDHVIIVRGIASGDEIAVNAQFLVDNEGFIKIQ
jgi:Cu(I)/Ag(I) efflux system membrane fusion protein